MCVCVCVCVCVHDNHGYVSRDGARTAIMTDPFIEANWRTVSAPIPLVPPVTTMCLPVHEQARPQVKSDAA